MKNDLVTNQKRLSLLMLLIVMSACNPSEYYEKEGLSEISLPNPGGEIEVITETPNAPGGGETNPGNPTNPTQPGTPTVPNIVLNDRVEKFIQNTAQTHPVDILWVIDDSGSMADEQTALATNFGSFINQFLNKNVDFKMAITTTDGTSSKNGAMVGDSNLLTSTAAKKNKAKFISDFRSLVKVGTRGSGKEQGLQTSENFIFRYGKSFLRENAVLAIVYVTDEEDSSPKTIKSYLDSLQATKENKALVKAYSIITTKEKSNYNETWGSRYEEVSKLTAGVVSDIKKDFSGTLLNIGDQIVTLLDSFALNESPYQNQVKVYVDGVEVVEGWKFNADQRSLTFQKTNLPKQGAKIEIHYKVAAQVLGAI